VVQRPTVLPPLDDPAKTSSSIRSVRDETPNGGIGITDILWMAVFGVAAQASYFLPSGFCDFLVLMKAVSRARSWRGQVCLAGLPAKRGRADKSLILYRFLIQELSQA
jgi:hypothetical protein